MEVLKTIAKANSFQALSEQLFQSPKVISMQQQKAIEEILDLITKTAYKCGHQIYKAEIKQSKHLQELMLATMLYEEISDSYEGYKWITLREMHIAFNRGLKGRYGEYFGLNIRTFCKWMDGFKEKDRNAEMAKLKPLNKKPLRIEKKIDRVKSVQDEFEIYKKQGNISITFPIAYYDWLIKSGAMKQPDKKESLQIYKDQKAKSQKEVKKQNQMKSLIDRTFRTILPSDTTIQSRCKAYTIKQWFNELIANKQEPSDILSNLKNG